MNLLSLLETEMTDPARWLINEVPGWRQLEIRERKAIRDFPVLWSLFELHATGNGRRPNASPRRISTAVEELPEVPNSAVIDRARTYFADRYFRNPRMSVVI